MNVRHEAVRRLTLTFTRQLLGKLAKEGLVYKNRHGRYSFAVPLLGEFIKRQLAEWPG